MHYFLSSVATYLKGCRISNISAPCSPAPTTVSGSIGKRMWLVLAIAECIKTDAAHSKVFALQIDGPFNLTFTRHFQSV